MDIALQYERPSAVVTTADATTVALATNTRRSPVAFRGRVRDPLRLRQLLLAQHAVATAGARGGITDANWRTTLDPLVTVQPERLVFETLSNDGSCYARLSASMEAFDVEGEPQTGTTNIDFTWDLAPALKSLRSSRPTTLAIGGDVGGPVIDGYARIAEMPDQWVKGYLQVQGALTAHPFTISARPVDLASIITFLDEHYTRRSPQGMRYVFQPGDAIKVVLEPWEQPFTLRGTRYNGFERTVRLWGRKRLSLLSGVLPFADHVTIAILGRGLPHVYICHCGPYQFMLAVSGWTADDWTMGSGFDLLAAFTGATAERTSRVADFLAAHPGAQRDDIAAGSGIPAGETEQALFQLSRAGRVLYDPLSGRYQARDLFAEPLDLEALFVADPRLEAAQALLEAGQVQVRAVTQGGSRARPDTRIIAVVHDDIDYTVTVQVDENGRLRYGRCQCAFFRMNTLTRGPCAHILAARLAFDTPTASEPFPPVAVPAGLNDDDDDVDETDEDEEDVPF